MARILFDVSYTRSQAHPTGIPRTVTKLGAALAGLQGGEQFVPVAYHAGTLRVVKHWDAAPATSVAAVTPSGKPSWWIAKAAPWISARLPTFARRWAIAAYNERLYNRLSGVDQSMELARDDVLLLTDASWDYAIWRAAARVQRAGGRVVLMVHDIMPIRQPAFCSPLFAWAFERWLRRMLRIADAVICNSRATEADLQAWAAHSGIALAPTGSFRLGADAVAGPGAGNVRPALQAFMDEGAAAFASVGTVEPKKNYGFLLDTFERLWSTGVDARLVVAGRVTVQCAALADRFTTHPEHGRRLLLLTDANDAEIAFLYARSRALLLASLFEGFGLPLVEARTQGCRVIANDLPSFRELADEGVTLYRSGDESELERLIRARAQAPAFAHAPAMRPFGWNDSARQCLRLLENLLPRVRGGLAAAASAGTGSYPPPTVTSTPEQR